MKDLYEGILSIFAESQVRWSRGRAGLVWLGNDAAFSVVEDQDYANERDSAVAKARHNFGRKIIPGRPMSSFRAAMLCDQARREREESDVEQAAE